MLRDSHCIYHPVLPPRKNDPGYGLSEGKENAGRPGVKKMEWCPETVTVTVTLFCHRVKMTLVTASLKVKKMRGGSGKKDGVVPRDSHCLYHSTLPPSKNDPGYGLSKGKENAGRPGVKKMEWCPDTVTVFITLFFRYVKMTQVTASLKVKKMQGGPGKKDGVVLRDSHCIYDLSPCSAAT